MVFEPSEEHHVQIVPLDAGPELRLEGPGIQLPKVEVPLAHLFAQFVEVGEPTV